MVSPETGAAIVKARELLERAELELQRALNATSRDARELDLFPLKDVCMDHSRGFDEFKQIPLLVIKEVTIPPDGLYGQPKILVLTDQGKLFTCPTTDYLQTGLTVIDFDNSRSQELKPGNPDFLKYGPMALKALMGLIEESGKGTKTPPAS